MQALQEILVQARGIPMYIVFLSLMLIFFMVNAVSGARDAKKQRDASVTEKEKCKKFFQTICWLWGMALVIFMLCFIGGISLKEIGFRKVSFNYGFWFNLVTLSLSGVFFAFCLYNLIFSLISVKYRESQAKDLSSGEENVLPRSKKEKILFSFVAFSAGVCEEIVFRGFLLFLMMAVFPDIPIYLVVLIPSIAFGISHCYQGLGGVLKTGILGALFMCLYLVTDSLILVMLLHFFMDFSATFLLSGKDDKQTLKPL